MRARDSYLPALAAIAAGGLTLMSRRRRRAEDYLDSFADEARQMQRRIPARTNVLGLAALVGGAYLLLRKRSGASVSSTVTESIDLDVPVSTAYNQWTQFEDFPQFMNSVESVSQVDDTHMHWRAVIAGKTQEWDAEITEQIPDERIAWRSTSGVPNSGVVTFRKLGDSRTRVVLQMEYDPQSLPEKLADAGGAVKLTTKGNLKRFKKLLESRRQETGAWRGTVTQH